MDDLSFSAVMNKQEQQLFRFLRRRVDAFDQIIDKYQSLVDDAGFYSKNWVELAEIIEAELRKIEATRDG